MRIPPIFTVMNIEEIISIFVIILLSIHIPKHFLNKQQLLKNNKIINIINDNNYKL